MDFKIYKPEIEVKHSDISNTLDVTNQTWEGQTFSYPDPKFIT